MEYIFLLAERIVYQLKSELSANKTVIGYYSFNKSLIQNSSFEIEFNYNESQIKCQLSTHPLDMPWKVKLSINNTELQNNYEVYPNLLKSPKILGNELAITIAKDVIKHLKSINLIGII